MKATPTDEEAAAIAAALLQYAASRAEPPAAQDSGWRDAARREGVLSNVPRTWRE